MTDYLRRRVDMDELAPVFDEATLWGARFAFLMLDELELRPGIRALDVGCATGLPLIELASMHGAKGRFTGIDVWSSALHRAQKRIAFQGLRNADLVEGDGHKLPFRNASFDLIVSNLGINNFDDPDAVFRECARVARRDARLVLTTNVRGHMAELYDVFRSVVPERYRERLEANEAHRGDVASLRERIETAGFAVMRVVERSFALRFLDGSALLRHPLVYWFLMGWRAVVDPADEETVFAELERRLDQQGPLRMTVPMVYVEAVSS
ncbi:MAG TPA: methyltransferase domain-containing protein [Thermoanaerobaculia bacterium]|nr:methyltransferase domain-containing protein [Thermoanaerobaculia bacterium]